MSTTIVATRTPRGWNDPVVSELSYVELLDLYKKRQVGGVVILVLRGSQVGDRFAMGNSQRLPKWWQEGKIPNLSQ